MELGEGAEGCRREYIFGPFPLCAAFLILFPLEIFLYTLRAQSA